MPRLTVDIDSKFNDTLSTLAAGGSKADVLRRAVASYHYLNSEIGAGDPGTRLAITDAAGNIQKDVVLPSAKTVTDSPAQPAAPSLSAHASVVEPHLTHVLAPRTVDVSSGDVGSIEIAPPSFLERWGVIFLAVFSLWIVLTGSVLLLYFLRNQPPAPSLSGLSPDALRDTLVTHKQLVDQWRDSLTYIFDLLITKTALPLVTLLLGYLFGKAQASPN